MSCPADSARSTAESGISRDIIPGCRETPVRDVVNQNTAEGADRGRLVVEIRTRNVGMNGVLQRLGYPIADTRES